MYFYCVTDTLRNTSFVAAELFFHWVKVIVWNISKSLLRNGENFAHCILHKIIALTNGMYLSHRQTCMIATWFCEMFVSCSSICNWGIDNCACQILHKILHYTKVVNWWYGEISMGVKRCHEINHMLMKQTLLVFVFRPSVCWKLRKINIKKFVLLFKIVYRAFASVSL